MTKTKKKQLGELEEYLVNRIDLYVKEVNKHRPKGKKISRIGLVETYFTDFLSDKVLTKDYITLKEPYYYNTKKLIKNSEVIATTEKPISEYVFHVKIEKIPNNLDSWSTEHNTYCYNNNPQSHRGIEIANYYPFHTDLDDLKAHYTDVLYLVYRLIENELKVGLVKSESLSHFLNDLKEEDLLIELACLESQLMEFLEEKDFYELYPVYQQVKKLGLPTNRENLEKIVLYNSIYGINIVNFEGLRTKATYFRF